MTVPRTPPDGDDCLLREMGIVPGARVGFEKDGVVYVDTVTCIEPGPHLSVWQRIVRRLTPKRRRKPLLSTVTIKTGSGKDPVKRAQASIAKALDAIERLEQ